MQRRQKIQDTGGSQQARAVITVGVRNVGATGFDGAREEVETAGAEVGDVAERVKGIAALSREDVPFHGSASEDEQTNSEEDNQSAAPHPLQCVAEARQEPAGDAESDGAGFTGKGFVILARRGWRSVTNCVLR